MLGSDERLSDPAPPRSPPGIPLAAIDGLVDKIAQRLGGTNQRQRSPANYRRHQILSVLAFAGVVWAFVTVFVTQLNTIGLIQLWLFYVILGTGFYLSFAMAGRIAVCQAFMAGVGAYSSAWATRSHTFLVGLGFAILTTAVLSLLLARLLSKSGHFYFAIATLGLAEIGHTVFTKWHGFTGPSGLVGGIPPIELFGRTFSSSRHVMWAFLIVASLCLLVVALIERSPLRREVIATRDIPMVASASGVSIEHYKTGFFVLGSVMAGIGGSLFAHWQAFLAPESFGIDLSIGLFLMVILGGAISPWGVVLGAAFYVWAPEYLKNYHEWQSLIYGALLMIIIIVLPEGLVGLGHRSVRQARRLSRRRRGAVDRA